MHAFAYLSGWPCNAPSHVKTIVRLFEGVRKARFGLESEGRGGYDSVSGVEAATITNWGSGPLCPV